MYKVPRFMRVILISVMGCLLLACLWMLLLEMPYRKFREKVHEIRPQLMALNDDILKLIPSPVGVTETERSYNGATSSPVHTVYTDVIYRLQTTTELSRAMKYYDDILISTEWNKKQLGMHDVLYFREAACIKISSGYGEDLTTYDENSRVYYVRIWHDFTQVDFTPKPPLPVVMFFHEMGYTDYMPCPPE